MDHLNATLKLEIIGLSPPDLASTHAVFLILFPVILLACVVVTVFRILVLDFEEVIGKVNKPQLSAALVRVSHPSREVERLDVIAEESVGKEEAFQSQIATLQVELLLQKLVTGDNLEKLEAREEKNRKQDIKLKAAQEEVIALELEVEELGRKISEGELGMRAAQQEIVKLIMKAAGQGETQGRTISTNRRCVEAAQKEIVKLNRELTEARKSHK